MWHIGQRVVCVKQFHARYTEHITIPVVGDVYTVRDIYVSPTTGELGFRLEEIYNAPSVYSDGIEEVAFHERFFRPVVEPKTSLEVFHKIRRDVEADYKIKTPEKVS